VRRVRCRVHHGWTARCSNSWKGGMPHETSVSRLLSHRPPRGGASSRVSALSRVKRGGRFPRRGFLSRRRASVLARRVPKLRDPAKAAITLTQA
jgi:hypothetical protein